LQENAPITKWEGLHVSSVERKGISLVTAERAVVLSATLEEEAAAAAAETEQKEEREESEEITGARTLQVRPEEVEAVTNAENLVILQEIVPQRTLEATTMITEVEAAAARAGENKAVLDLLLRRKIKVVVATEHATIVEMLDTLQETALKIKTQIASGVENQDISRGSVPKRKMTNEEATEIIEQDLQHALRIVDKEAESSLV